MIVVTGGLGFIGSNLVKKLNKINIDDIIIVDSLESSGNYKNLKDLKFKDFVSTKDFIHNLNDFEKIKFVFHIGACSDTTENNGNYIYENNYLYSKKLIQFFSNKMIPLVYASSASVYGLGNLGFKEDESIENPLNLYAVSKFLTDNFMNSHKFNSQVVGLRFFNVYGPGEEHKGEMKSVIGKFLNNIKKNPSIKLFKGSEKIFRDFIFVDDVCDICIFFMNNNFSGIYNVGTGSKNSFMKIYEIINRDIQKCKLELIDFPKKLIGKYQFNTEAEISKLRKIGFKNKFVSLKEGINKYYIHENK